MISMGWTNPTPVGHVPRGARGRARRADRDAPSRTRRIPRTTIFNFHAPPYGSRLDHAPALNDDMTYKAGGQALRPVGSTAVRDADDVVPTPAVAARPHPREQGRVRRGTTLALNPGSSYEEGVLQAAVVNIDLKKLKVKNYHPGQRLVRIPGRSRKGGRSDGNGWRSTHPVPAQGDGTGQGLVEVRRFLVLVHVRQLRDARAVLRAVRARRSCPNGQVLPALLISGRLRDVPRHHLRGPDLGDAARGRRLRLAEPGAGRRDRVPARHHRVVVHPVVLGADLREHPQRRGAATARRDLQVARPLDVPRARRTACSPSAWSRWCSPGSSCRWAWRATRRSSRYCFYIGMVGARARDPGIMLFGSQSGFLSAFNTESANLFGANGDAYDADAQGRGRRTVVPEARVLAVLRAPACC